MLRRPPEWFAPRKTWQLIRRHPLGSALGVGGIVILLDIVGRIQDAGLLMEVLFGAEWWPRFHGSWMFPAFGLALTVGAFLYLGWRATRDERDALGRDAERRQRDIESIREVLRAELAKLQPHLATADRVADMVAQQHRLDSVNRHLETATRAFDGIDTAMEKAKAGKWFPGDTYHYARPFHDAHSGVSLAAAAMGAEAMEPLNLVKMKPIFTDTEPHGHKLFRRELNEHVFAAMDTNKELLRRRLQELRRYVQQKEAELASMRDSLWIAMRR